MDGASLYAIGSGVSAIAGSPANSLIFDFLCNWWYKKRLARRVSGLILLKGGTTLCQKLTNNDAVYIDCDHLLQTLQSPVDANDHNKNQPTNPVDLMLSYSVIRKHILNISSIFKGRIILVSKTLDLLMALPVKWNNIHFSAFSKEMETNIGIIYPNENAHHQAEIEKFRIMRLVDEDHTYIVDSLKDLYDKTAERFDTKKVML
jgi:hypothetical protein